MLNNCAHIKTSVSHGSLRLIKNVDAESKMIESLGIEFAFETPEWDSLTKTIIFIKSGITPLAKILPAGQNCVSVPWEILDTCNTHADSFYEIGVLGTGTNGERLPTNRLKLKIDKSCYVNAQTPAAPTPDVYTTIIAMIQNLNDYDEDEIKAFCAEYLSDNNYAQKSYVDAHANDTTKHITSQEKATWNAKANTSDIPTKLSQLTNDANFTTETYVDDAIDNLGSLAFKELVGTTDLSPELYYSINNKATKVVSATANDFAGLNANGDLIDSGKKASDFATAAQGATADQNALDIQTLDTRVDALEALTPAEAGAQVNVIESITVGGSALAITNKTVALPLATASALGLARADGTSIESANGVFSVKAVNVQKLFIADGDELVLNGGTA